MLKESNQSSATGGLGDWSYFRCALWEEGSRQERPGCEEPAMQTWHRAHSAEGVADAKARG